MLAIIHNYDGQRVLFTSLSLKDLKPWWPVGQGLPRWHAFSSSQEVSPKAKGKIWFYHWRKTCYYNSHLNNVTPSLRTVAKHSLGLVYHLVASLEIILQSSASHRVGQRLTCVCHCISKQTLRNPSSYIKEPWFSIQNISFSNEF